MRSRGFLKFLSKAVSVIRSSSVLFFFFYLSLSIFLSYFTHRLSLESVFFRALWFGCFFFQTHHLHVFLLLCFVPRLDLVFDRNRRYYRRVYLEGDISTFAGL